MSFAETVHGRTRSSASSGSFNSKRSQPPESNNPFSPRPHQAGEKTQPAESGKSHNAQLKKMLAEKDPYIVLGITRSVRSRLDYSLLHFPIRC